MSYYFFCHVTDEQPLNTRPSMRGENDQIDALIFCRVENLFEGDYHLRQDIRPLVGPRPMDNLPYSRLYRRMCGQFFCIF